MSVESDKGSASLSAPVGFRRVAEKVWRITAAGPAWTKVPSGLVAALFIAIACTVLAVAKGLSLVFVTPIARLARRRHAVGEIGSPRHGVKYRQIP